MRYCPESKTGSERIMHKNRIIVYTRRFINEGKTLIGDDIDSPATLIKLVAYLGRLRDA